MTHVAWNCDGKKLAAVGIDKITRVWSPEKSVSTLQLVINSPILLWSILQDGDEGCIKFLWRTFR